MPGKGKGKGESRPPLKENKLVASAVKERAPNKPDLFKAFITKFVRLNGILFTRTRLVVILIGIEDCCFKMIHN